MRRMYLFKYLKTPFSSIPNPLNPFKLHEVYASCLPVSDSEKCIEFVSLEIVRLTGCLKKNKLTQMLGYFQDKTGDAQHHSLGWENWNLGSSREATIDGPYRDAGGT